MLDVRERLAADDLPERLTLLGFRDDDRADALAAAAAVLEEPDEIAAVQAMAERLVPAIGLIGDPWDGVAALALAEARAPTPRTGPGCWSCSRW